MKWVIDERYPDIRFGHDGNFRATVSPRRYSYGGVDWCAEVRQPDRLLVKWDYFHTTPETAMAWCEQAITTLTKPNGK